MTINLLSRFPIRQLVKNFPYKITKYTSRDNIHKKNRQNRRNSLKLDEMMIYLKLDYWTSASLNNCELFFLIITPYLGEISKFFAV